MKVKTKGELFVEELLNGSFKKNYRSNHGSDFTEGLEDLYAYYFSKYIRSCGCYLMDISVQRGEYHG